MIETITWKDVQLVCDTMHPHKHAWLIINGGALSSHSRSDNLTHLRVRVRSRVSVGVRGIDMVKVRVRFSVKNSGTNIAREHVVQQ